MEEELAESNEEYVTDDRLRLIIITTGLWVAFKEGWSPSFKYDDKDTTAQRSPSRTTSFSPLTTPPASPGPASPSLEKRNSIASAGSSLFRKGSLLGKSNNRASTASVPEERAETEMAQTADATKKTGRTRADSASTVLVHRAASNRVKHQQAAWRESLAMDIAGASVSRRIRTRFDRRRLAFPRATEAALRCSANLASHE